MTERDPVETAIRDILTDILGLDAGVVAGFTRQTALFGALPELDSMAVASLLTALEDRLQFVIDDDEVSGEMLESFGALVDFAAAKRAAKP